MTIKMASYPFSDHHFLDSLLRPNQLRPTISAFRPLFDLISDTNEASLLDDLQKLFWLVCLKIYRTKKFCCDLNFTLLYTSV